ncbi:MAG: lipid-binding SYLF domain-containing protein, partial [Terriglobales bacterium]
VVLCGLAANASAGISSRADDVARIQAAQQIFDEVTRGAGRGIAENVLQAGECLAIVPGNKTFALGIGVIYGKGVALCRQPNGQWSAPMFITVGGASFGVQFGGESADLVLVFQNRSGLESMLNNKMRIGVQASAAAGPVGRQVEASTDAAMHAQVLAYAHSRGLYAGFNANGAIVQPDESGNRAMYGRAYWQDILDGRVRAPTDARVLLTELNRSPYTNPIRMAELRRSRGATATPAGRAVSPFAPSVRTPLPFSVGISYPHQSTTIGLGGFELWGGFRPWINKIPELKVVADVSRVKGSQDLLGASVSNSQWTWMFGPEFDFPRRLFSPYAHALFGEGHLNTSTFTTTSQTVGSHSYVWEVGAGLRLTPARQFTIQLIQIDRLHSTFNSKGTGNWRISFGVGFAF